jgi:mono/diheme cytochrome c family protein
MTDKQNQEMEDQKLLGLLAQFEDPSTLIKACNEARESGYKKIDAFSPFPVHGIDPALGIPRTILPFFVLIIGLTGCAVGLGMQYYANAGDWSSLFPGYNFMISGKPFFSLPANIPVTFEVVVLSSAIATFLGMWALNRLPRLANPLHRISRFKRVTNDKFFLLIETKDPKFSREQTESELNQWGASAIEEVNEDLTDQQLPSWLQLVGLMTALILLIPPVLIFRAEGMTNRKPRLHVVPDMDWQDKYKTQTMAPNLGDEKHPVYLFVDGRAMQEPIPGTIARGDLDTDSEYYRGIKSGTESFATLHSAGARTGLQDAAPQEPSDQDTPAAESSAEPAEPDWVTQFPPNVTVDQALLERGQQRFNIYCSVCHGYAGNGDGLVNVRAMALAASGQATWTAAKSLNEPEVIKNPVGRIFDTISNGRGTMGPYKSQIPVEDRWAIVAYVRALQGTGLKPEGVTKADEDTVEE